jgi:glycosyltransferase involved in cell wall biosynthesis
MTKDRILVFIPAYNCERQLPRVLAQFTPELQALFSKLIIVNNRSTDATENAALEAIGALTGLDASVLRNRDNYGLGGSHKVAFAYALEHGYTHILVLHGDDQGSVENIASLLAAGRHRELDCLLGARFHPESKLKGYSAFRTFGNRVYNALFGAVCGLRVHDLGSGLNLYSSDALRGGFYKLFPDDLTFNYCMVLAHAFLKHRVEFFPISWREEDQVSNVKLYSQSVRVLRLLRDFALDRQGFLARDNRARPVENYEADEVGSNAAARGN